MNTIAVTGASGYIGQRLIALLEAEPAIERILALDMRRLPSTSPKMAFVEHDVTHPTEALFLEHGVQGAVHLAFLVDPIYDRTRERRIHVGGTENFLAACHAAHVKALPPRRIYPLAALAWKLHLRALSEAPPAMLDYIRYSWVADRSKVIQVTDFRYRYDGYGAMESFLQSRGCK